MLVQVFPGLLLICLECFGIMLVEILLSTLSRLVFLSSSRLLSEQDFA